MTGQNNSTSFQTQGTFEEPQVLRWFLRMTYVVVFAFGVFGNGVVCGAITLKKKMHQTRNNFFTLNLACSDLLVLLIYVPTQMAAFENHHNWPLGDFVCLVAYIIIPLCLSASIGTLLVISWCRYKIICHPLTPKLSLRRTKIIITTIWLLSFLTALPLIFVAKTQNFPNGQVYCSESWPENSLYEHIYWISIFVIQYIIPLCVITGLTFFATSNLKQSSMIIKTRRPSQILTAAILARIRQETRIAKMLVALVVLYGICMLPQHIVYFWMKFGNLNSLSYKMYIFRLSNVFPMVNSALNPIAYGTLNKEFKTVFQNVFQCRINLNE